MKELIELNAVAAAACAAFHDALVTRYGKKNAGDARYQYVHDCPIVTAAKNAYGAASTALHNARVLHNWGNPR